LSEQTAAPHGENIADDAADTGRRALERLDGTGVVVRLDLKGNREAIPISMMPAFSSQRLREFWRFCGKPLSNGRLFL